MRDRRPIRAGLLVDPRKPQLHRPRPDLVPRSVAGLDRCSQYSRSVEGDLAEVDLPASSSNPFDGGFRVRMSAFSAGMGCAGAAPFGVFVRGRRTFTS